MFDNNNEDGVSRSTMVKYGAAGVVAVIAFIASIALVSAGSMNRASASEWGCVYGGGLFESKGLKEAVAPGESGGFTVADKFVTGPATERFFAVNEDATKRDVGGEPRAMPDKTGVRMVANFSIRMKFNEDYCKWYSSMGSRNEPLDFNGATNPTNPTGWAKFLRDFVKDPVIDPALSTILAKGDYFQFQVNSVQPSGKTLYQEIGKELASTFMEQQKSVFGGTFLCGPSYTYDGNIDGKFDCPPVEVVITSIEPVDTTLRSVREKQRSNEEAKKLAESERDLKITQQNAAAQTAVNAEENRQKTESAKLAADKAIEQERAGVLAEQQQNAEKQAAIAQAWCTRLVELGQNCALVKAAETGSFPQVIGSSDVLVGLK